MNSKIEFAGHLIFFIYFSLHLLRGSQALLKVSETNSSYDTFVELLRGRDGLPGRDGVRGPPGPQGKEGPPGPKSGGAIFTRWGKRVCPSTAGTEEVYSGIAAGTHYTDTGGGSNTLCMPKVPEYTLPFSRNGPVQKASLYGAEYEHPLRGTQDHNIPCAVCHVTTRSVVLMIPGNSTCPLTWTREYYGYLMAEHNYHKRSSMFECVDSSMESLPGSYRNTNGALFYHVEAVCGVGLPCPSYNNYKELNCVVCSK